MKKNFLVIFSLFVCIIASIFVRYEIFKESSEGSFIPYTNVDAVHYYFTKLVSEGKGISGINYALQYPEGVNVNKELSVFMEYPVGLGYRLLSGFTHISLDDYIRLFIWVLFGLSNIGIYFLAKGVTKNRLASIFAAFFYSFSIASLNRTAGFGYMRENFALPMIIFFLAFFVISLDERKGVGNRYIYSFISGLFLYIALASWQLTQFFYLLFLLYVFINLLLNKTVVVRSALIVLIFAVLAGVFVGYLKSNNFLISSTMLFGYSIFLTYILRQVFRIKREYLVLFIILAIFAAMKLPTFRLSTDLTNYSHVYELVLFQILNFGVKPPDPSLIPMDARMLWDVAHSRPFFKEVIEYLGLVLLLGTVPFIKVVISLAKKKEKSPEEILLVYFTILFFFLYLLVNRLMVFIIIFLAIWAGRFFTIFNDQQRLYRKAAIFLTIFLVLMQFSLDFRIRVTGVDTKYIVELLNWVAGNTRANSVILASPRSSPDILAYTGRPVVLHAKLETKQIRDKSFLWAKTLFSDSEEDFYNLCRKWGVDYFVFSKGTYLENGPSSWRYIINGLDDDQKSLAYRMEALPPNYTYSKVNTDGLSYEINISSGFNKPQLKHFNLVWSNKYFNVYKIN